MNIKIFKMLFMAPQLIIFFTWNFFSVKDAEEIDNVLDAESKWRKWLPTEIWIKKHDELYIKRPMRWYYIKGNVNIAVSVHTKQLVGSEPSAKNKQIETSP